MKIIAAALDFVSNNFVTIIASITGLAAWGNERNKRRLVIKQMEAENMSSHTENQKNVVDLYREALSDLKKIYDDRFTELEKEIKELKEESEKLKVEAAKEKVKYSNLKRAFDDYKKRQNEKN